MSELLFVVHPDRDDALDIAAAAAERLIAAGHTVRAEAAFADNHDSIEAYGADNAGEADGLDAVVAFGGDGTMLHAVHVLDGAAAPILAVNLGNLGYLTEIEPAELQPSIERVLSGPDAGGWTTDRRMMLDLVLSTADGTQIPIQRALNEVVIEKDSPGHTISLAVRIDGERFTTYAADGMIVATPTGSTAYSMSARGPIVSPKHRAILVTPVAPHMLFDRTMVLDPTERVTLELIGERRATVTVDGRWQADLDPGGSVRCFPSDITANFVRFGDVPYHQVLKTKFGLADR